MNDDELVGAVTGVAHALNRIADAIDRMGSADYPISINLGHGEHRDNPLHIKIENE